jgi:hypothetical protein
MVERREEEALTRALRSCGMVSVWRGTVVVGWSGRGRRQTKQNGLELGREGDTRGVVVVDSTIPWPHTKRNALLVFAVD